MTSMLLCSMFFYFFFNNTAPTEIYTLSLHDALPISIWFFIPCLLAGALPWSVLVLAGWRRSLRLRGADRRIDPARLYLALWIALPLVLFSLSHSKRPQYILPLLPAVAILAAKVWIDAEE